MLFYVPIDHRDYSYKGREAQDGHLDFHSSPELSENSSRACGGYLYFVGERAVYGVKSSVRSYVELVHAAL